MSTLIHVTHEAIQKVGGIGAVLQGFFTAKAYNDSVGRSILIGPGDRGVADLLAKNGQVLYSSFDGTDAGGWADKFRPVQQRWGVGILYGRRTFKDRATGVESRPEVILMDVGHADLDRLGECKRMLYERFGIRSDLYRTWEYEHWVRLAAPGLAALDAIGADQDRPAVILAHEFMGMPLALAAIAENSGRYRTAFYAHEVATMRRIVEGHPGHDTMFYNVLDRAMAKGKFVEDVFGLQAPFFKHALVSASRFCDAVLCVGDHVLSEIKFLGADFAEKRLSLVYNGVPAYEVAYGDVMQSKTRLQQYTENILEYRPDFVFSHVTRMALSKGMWRDLKVLWHLEKKFRETGQTGVLFLLSSELGAPRKGHEILDMEGRYSWPVAHREGYPDLSGGEANFYVHMQKFNACARQIKVILVNQFGWSRPSCGMKMPADMDFLDIRKGTDIEFGQSIYEPFGIAQLEPLSFGSLCVITNVCGCAGFVDRVTGGQGAPNVLVADYTGLPDNNAALDSVLSVGPRERNAAEEKEAKRIADIILKRLPGDQKHHETLIRNGYELARQMSWEVVVRDYLLPVINDLS
ncbi:MAG TPA: hypothetical protein VM431_06110 [Phycisphaerae bacterium]|nr:hypothetical protein [Phycisphaerae bacterium]